MKTKIFIIIFSLLFLSLMFSIQISAFDWNQYGSDSVNSNTQTQTFYGLFTQNLTTFSKPIFYGYSGIVGNFEVQSLDIERQGNIYIVIPNGNYIQVYNKNLQLLNEISASRIISHLSLTSTVGSSSPTDSFYIGGVFETSSSIISFKEYMFNVSSGSFTKITETNYTTDNSNYTIAGVKKSGDLFYFIQYQKINSANNYAINLIKVNSTQSTILVLPNITSNLTEIPAVFDLDNDGVKEIFSFSKNTTVIYDTNDGSLEYDYNYTGTASQGILSAKLFRPDLTSQYRIVILQVIKNGGSDRAQVIAQKIDRSAIWSNTNLLDDGNSGDFIYASMGVSTRFRNTQGYDYVYIASTTVGSNPRLQFWVLNGNDGSTYLTNFTVQNSGSLAKPKLSLADMNNNNFDDFILTTINNTWIFDPSIPSYIVNKAIIPSSSFGIPTDINFDGFLESLYIGTSNSSYLYSNTSNINPTISVVTYSPSLNIQVGDVLSMIITASDNENNQIYYSRSCFDGDSYSTDSTQSTQTCTYGSSGIYNSTVRVRDSYHSTYNQFSTLVTVTSSGTTCNNNNVCESGETTSSCPNDCPIVVTNNTVQVNGGVSFNSQPVNPDNINEGFLPEIYFAIINFFSASGVQIIMIFLAILSVLFFFALMGLIGSIISKALRGGQR